ncbi:MAG: hypothetical protein HXY34_08265 [Candidatus Thorarchaeota archaeon]|nr:hypothetical protein [Candidatus Thorarchaeota archaeon]
MAAALALLLTILIADLVFALMLWLPLFQNTEVVPIFVFHRSVGHFKTRD